MQQRRALNQSASGKQPKRTNRDIIRGIESSFCSSNDNVQQEAVSNEVHEIEEHEVHPSEVTFTIFEDESETVSKTNGKSNGHKSAAGSVHVHEFNHLPFTVLKATT
jgi:FKBP-type peptidyl-prolyl cis-trans isomerase